MAWRYWFIARKDPIHASSFLPSGGKNETYGVKARALTGAGFLICQDAEA
ncbi:MAG: hypothetical protein JWP13_388 [Candidatus Saccharibacteria bacterium]|nr:hypothetical protein [Candidatus Saccharibacteria bacterium]